ncbi:Flagellar protein FlgJ [peptidoglycan hydrolase] [hydrothermal vent metagenome]|uniref:Flagellar protein FlgJ [peptidoglycan hydrolase] n=1 Tax=hydrothermal vent metagenome TaxID=652676 RepID=A0A3B1AC20_9ZZZZ
MLDAAANRAYTDFSQFAEMRLNAKQDPNASLQEVARQFESIFINMVMKSMRDASFGDPLFDSNQSDMYQEMFDKQIALDMSKGKGLGLADALVVQMRQYVPASKNNIDAVTAVQQPAKDPFIIQRESTTFSSSEQFVNTIQPYAEAAAEELDVDPKVLIAQAALETGWGKAIGKLPNGNSSYNLFNIKAQRGYDGDKYVKQTIEINNGIAKTESAAFRSYNSYQESFNDYVDFIKSNPRYEDALNVSSDSFQYIDSIHRAGYATDPRYAEKIKNVMQSFVSENEINTEDFV